MVAPVKKLYSAANLPDAHIVLNLLASEGIAARVFNQNAQGGLGEIPFNEAYPEVWLIDAADFTRAHALLLEYQRCPPEPDTKACPHCRETNPRNFQICWNCAEALTA